MPPRMSRQEKARVRDRSGITAASLAAEGATLVPPPAGKPISGSTQSHHMATVKVFDKFLADRQVIVSGERLNSWETWHEKSLPFPVKNVIGAFLMAYLKDAKGRHGAPIFKQTLKIFWLTFCSAWRRTTGCTVSLSSRVEGLDWVLELAEKKKLPDVKKDCARLTRPSLMAMFSGLWDEALSHTLRYRVAIATFVAFGAQTGLRPSSMVRGVINISTKTDSGTTKVNKLPSVLSDDPAFEKRMGARYGHFEIWAHPARQAGNPNELLGFYRTPWAKTKGGEKAMPLIPGPTVTSSTLIMVVISLVLDEYISVQDFRAIFDPATLGGLSWIRVKLPAACLDKPIFQLRNGNPIKTSWMTDKLQKLSVHLGFKVLATAYSFRHMVAEALQRNNESMDAIQNLLGHRRGSAATAYYLGRHKVIDTRSAMLDVDPNLPKARQSLQRIHAFPDPAAPNQLTRQQRDEIGKAISKERDQMHAVLSRSGATAKEKVKARNDFCRVEQRATKRKLTESREDYFEQRKRSKPVQRTDGQVNASAIAEEHAEYPTKVNEAVNKGGEELYGTICRLLQQATIDTVELGEELQAWLECPEVGESRVEGTGKDEEATAGGQEEGDGAAGQEAGDRGDQDEEEDDDDDDDDDEEDEECDDEEDEEPEVGWVTL